jgi:hypothetical protein
MELIRLVGKGLEHGDAFGSQLHHPLRQSYSARCPKDIARTGTVLPMRFALPNQPRPDLVVLPLPLHHPRGYRWIVARHDDREPRCHTG